jgi:hypothetical protein
MTFRFTLVTLGAALSFAAGASGHSGAPFVAKAEAERLLALGSFQVSGRLTRVSEVSCFGVDKIRIKVGKVVKFRHFECLISPARERRFWIRFHTLKKSWTYGFLRFAE